MGTVKKILKGVGVTLAILVIIGILGAIFGPPMPKQDAGNPLSAGYQAGRGTQAIPDKDLVNQFYLQLRDKTDQADSLYKPFTVALQKRDVLGATRVALKIDQDFKSVWGEITKLETPRLQNESAELKLRNAKIAFDNCYLAKATVLSEFIKFSESPNMKKMAEITNTAETAQTTMIGGVVNLMEAGEMVGLKIEDFNKKL